MARTSPAPDDSNRTVPAPSPGGGGGGGGNEWKEWTDLPLDPTDGWTVVNGTGGGSATLGLDGDILEFEQTNVTDMRIQGSAMRGKAMIRSIHMKPWEDAGVPTPAGQAANIFQPEMMTLKIEVQFDTDGGGPINGAQSNGYGNHLVCLVGLSGYMNDQGGNPTSGGTGVLWLGSIVHKVNGNNPATNGTPNLYRSGFKTYLTNSGTQPGATWKNQLNAPPASHDSLVFATPPLRKEGFTGRTDIFAGSYASDQPFYPMMLSGQTLFDNTTKLSNPANQNFWHIALWFGTNTGTSGRGNIRIRKIRYILQPLQNRASLT